MRSAPNSGNLNLKPNKTNLKPQLYSPSGNLSLLVTLLAHDQMRVFEAALTDLAQSGPAPATYTILVIPPAINRYLVIQQPNEWRVPN